MLEERGTVLDHTTIFRWVLRFTPLLMEAFGKRKAPIAGRWRMDRPTSRSQAKTATTHDDTAEYCRYRLTNAGFDRELFASDAIATMHEASAGSLRGIDRIATLALRETARRKKKLVERDCIARVIDQDAEVQ